MASIIDRNTPKSAQDTFYVRSMKGVGRIYPANLH
jgi:hypothetical protein